MSWIKSPLRYPGGKSKAQEQIQSRIPSGIGQYRDPFVGGGSTFLNVKARDYWINDIDEDLMCFWHIVQTEKLELQAHIRAMKRIYKDDGRGLYTLLTNSYHPSQNMAGAARYFILNRITYAGVGRYSQTAFDGRFTDSCIDRLDIKLPYRTILTSVDYPRLLEAGGDDVFIFLDPPYLSARTSKLYRGHMEFDHVALARNLVKCEHDWLMTIDDCEEIRDLYRGWANIEHWQLQYSMSNKKGKELFVSRKAQK